MIKQIIFFEIKREETAHFNDITIKEHVFKTIMNLGNTWVIHR